MKTLKLFLTLCIYSVTIGQQIHALSNVAQKIVTEAQETNIINIVGYQEKQDITDALQACPKNARKLKISSAFQFDDSHLTLAASLFQNATSFDLCSFSDISQQGFIQFLQQCGSKIKTLRLNTVNFTCFGNLAISTINDTVLKAIAQHCPNLRTLDLSWCDVTDEGLQVLASACRKLKGFSFQAGHDNLVEGKGIQAILHSAGADLLYCSIAQVCDPQATTTLFDTTAIVEGCAACPNMGTLVFDVSDVDDSDMEYIATQCPNITELVFDSCESITPKALQSFNNLQKLKIDYCLKLQLKKLVNMLKRKPSVSKLTKVTLSQFFGNDGFEIDDTDKAKQFERLHRILPNGCNILT